MSLGAPAAQPAMPRRPFLSSPVFTPTLASSPFHGTATRVQAVQDNLKMFGISSSPLEKL